MDHLSRSLLNTFSTQPIDRCSLERKDTDWLSAQLAKTVSQYLVLDGHSVVCINRVPLVLTHEQFQCLNMSCNPILLGLKKTDMTPVFAVNIVEPEQALDILDNFNSIESLSLRDISSEIDSEISAMYSYAMMLNHWHLSTSYCTRCGSSLEMKEGGSIQQCCNESCAHIEYPRINSAVIMRVTKGDKILLARQENWTEKMYSVLAGFVEVGETLEHAVEREVMEEVNVAVENINYHSSQPWPFPNSLMLGYTAEATSEELDFERDDIEHALWLSAEEMKVKITDGTISPPGELSISYRLIDDWFQVETGESLNEFKSSLLL